MSAGPVLFLEPGWETETFSTGTAKRAARAPSDLFWFVQTERRKRNGEATVLDALQTVAFRRRQSRCADRELSTLRPDSHATSTSAARHLRCADGGSCRDLCARSVLCDVGMGRVVLV